jgi:hypothetical protein
MPTRILSLLFLACILSAGLAHAQSTSIPIQNSSFETANLMTFGNGGQGPYSNLIMGSTIDGFGGTLANWTSSSPTVNSGAGAWDPNPGGLNWTSKWWDGNNIAYLQISTAGTVSLSQTLSTTLQNNTTYTLSALVGRRIFVSRFSYALQLWAGSTMLASASNLALANDGSGTDSVSFSSGSNHPQAGQPVMIVLSCTGAAGILTEAFFDNITLTSSGGTTAATKILPQLAFGGGWYTALYLTNTTAAPASFTVSFTGDDGNPLTIPVLGGSSVTQNLAPRGEALIEAPNVGPLVNGYVSAALPAGVTGYGVFRQSIPGVPDQEAVVPLSGTTATTSTLIFDDTKCVTAVALVNLGSVGTTITVVARDSQGNTIGTTTLPLAAKAKKAVALRDLLAGIGGAMGSVDFTVNIGNLAALGLRFNGVAFTSIPTSDK